MNGARFDPEALELEIPDEVLFRDLGGESVLLHLGSGKYFGLDEVGTFFWNRLAAGSSLVEIGQDLLSEYEVDRDRLWMDLGTLVGELCEQGLLTPRPACASSDSDS